jgi:hypothetical protein
VITGSEGSTFPYSFTAVSTSLVTLQNSSVNALSFSASGSLFTLVGGGTNITIDITQISALSSSSDTSLILHDNMTVAEQGVNIYSFERVTITNVVVCMLILLLVCCLIVCCRLRMAVRTGDYLI